MNTKQESAKQNATEIQQSMQGDISRKNITLSSMIFHTGTPPKGSDNRGVGVTRKDKSSTKKAVKLASKQRQINLKRSNKKFRASGSKKRK